MPDQSAQDFYLNCLRSLDDAKIDYLLGGGHAMAHYTGIARETKDLDIFVRPGECRHAVDALGRAGYRVEWPWPHFLGRAVSDSGAFVDILFNSGNGLSPVDDEWFSNASPGSFRGHPLRFVPPEEMLWSKAFVMERDRFDGADVAHLILRTHWTPHTNGDDHNAVEQPRGLDWRRLIRRFAGHDRVLMAHLILFGYIYPTKQSFVPGWVLDELSSRIHDEAPVEVNVCRGTFLAQHQYQTDIHKWGYIDGRLQPVGPLRADDLARFAPPDAPPIR